MFFGDAEEENAAEGEDVDGFGDFFGFDGEAGRVAVFMRKGVDKYAIGSNNLESER